MPRTGQKGGSKSAAKNALYAHPLPLNLPLNKGSNYYATRCLGFVGLSNWIVEHPHCTGVFDRDSRSVWVTDENDMKILWHRGFFGKGNLSRSEPTWFARYRDESATIAEHITNQRRIERRKFKQERAKALEEAAVLAEAAFEAGVAPQPAVIPSRPDELHITLIPGIPQKEDLDADAPQENLEHLQLTLQEAFFLIWSIGCLTVIDPETRRVLSLSDIWRIFQACSIVSEPDIIRPDSPFIVNYVVYHHFRSLGWVVRSGIKFSADFLLYKKGPVFSHAEFALVIRTAYENPDDEVGLVDQSSFSEPFTWAWLSTLNRVNTQVQKSLILVYVTIPSFQSLSRVDTPAILALYRIREVAVRRFIPARMRD